MLTQEEFEDWCQRLKLPIATVNIIQYIRSIPINWWWQKKCSWAIIDASRYGKFWFSFMPKGSIRAKVALMDKPAFLRYEEVGSALQLARTVLRSTASSNKT